jgi:anti-anti-sigma factor
MADLVIKTMKMPDDIVAVGPEGVLDSNTEKDFVDTIKKLQDDGICNFIFDLSKLNAITSSGIGSFIKIATSCKENYGNIVIVQPQPSVKEALKMFGLFTFVQMADNVASAVKIIMTPPNK